MAPEVLVLDVDQPPRPAHRLGVAAGDAALAAGGERVVAAVPQVGVGPQQLDGVRPARAVAAAAARAARSGELSRPRSRSASRRHGARESGAGSSQRSRNTVSTSWTAGPADGHLDVVPRRVRAVLLGQRLGLRVAVVGVVVAPVVGQVDAADEGDVARGVVAVPDHDELLVVRAAGAHPHVEQHLGAPLLQLLPEVAVLGGEEAGPVEVRAPHQPAHDDAALVRAGQHLDDLAAGLAGEPLVGVTLPVGEEHEVARSGGLDRVVQGTEVRRAVDERADEVALRPRPVAAVAGVQRRGRVAPLGCGEEPVGRLAPCPPACPIHHPPSALASPQSGGGPGRPARAVGAPVLSDPSVR